MMKEVVMEKYFEKIYKGNLEQFLQLLEERMKNEERTFIVTANPETLMIGEKNSEFKRILMSDHTIITADGIGVVKGMQKLGYEIKERVTGVDIVKKMLVSANKERRSLYLFGAKQEVVSALAEKISQEYSDIQLLGYTNGYVSDKDEVFEKIKKLSPDIVLVALGIPAQELLIERHYEAFNKGIFIGIGGAFDVLSGMKKRAPKFFVKYNLEWLYRICSEPKRMKRFYQSNVQYLKIIKKMQKRGLK